MVIIKEADDRSGDLAELKQLLKDSSLSPAQKARIKNELRGLEIGAWGEQKAAYFLNFYYGKSRAHLLLHDLQIVLSDDRTAQIDHILINSFQDIYLLESKNWAQLSVDKAGACSTGSQRIIGVESPLEQARRHTEVLKRAFEIDPQLRAVAPRPQFLPRVLLAPRCHLKAPDHTQWYVKADIFHSQRRAELEKQSTLKNLLDLPRYLNEKNLVSLGAALLELHNPKRRNWNEKFGISSPRIADGMTAPQLLERIPSLIEFVPDYGEDWFVLERRPTEEEKSSIKRAGFRAEEKDGRWTWRRKR